MKFRTGLAASVCAGIFALTGCSGGGGDSDENQGGEGGGDGGGESGGEGGGAGASTSGGKGGTASSQGGSNSGGGGAGGTQAQGGSGGTVSLGTEPDPSSWGPCQMIPVPAGVMIGMTPLKTSPMVASKCIPAGSAISRSLSLMATSTPQKKHKVKVLFYGQSITRGGWTSMTEAYLRQTFPNADLEVRQEAIGAFGARELFRPLEADVITWYPDLVIYHNYGGYPDIDLLIQEIRRRTTAEVMHQSQHVTRESASTQAAYDRESYIYFPDIGKRLGIHTIDIRTPWKAYMQQRGKSAQDLTSDNVHLNGEGNTLYAQITNDNLKYNDKVLVDPLRMVNTFEVGKAINWVGKKLTFDFDGNRVDFVAKAGATIAAGGATILIDGKKPSEFAGAYGNTRANRELDNNWPWSIGSIMRVTIDPASAPKAEDWTLKLTSINKAGSCAFTVTGSVTGADGNGTCANDFVSTSKRVKIAKEDFFFTRPQNEVDNITIPVGYEIKWKTLALHTDSYPPATINAADTTKEYLTTIIQGIPNGKHKLEVTATGDQPPPIEAIRVHRPPLR